MKLFEKIDDFLNSPVPGPEDIKRMVNNNKLIVVTNRKAKKDEEKRIKDLAFNFSNDYIRYMFRIQSYAFDVANLDPDEEKWTEDYKIYIEAQDILGTVASVCMSMKKYYFYNPYDVFRSLGVYRISDDSISPIRKLGDAIDNAEKYVEKFEQKWPELYHDYDMRKWSEFKEELKNEEENK